MWSVQDPSPSRLYRAGPKEAATLGQWGRTPGWTLSSILIWADLQRWCKSRLIWPLPFLVGVMPGMHICIIFVLSKGRFQACEETACQAGTLCTIHQSTERIGIPAGTG